VTKTKNHESDRPISRMSRTPPIGRLSSILTCELMSPT